jgi:hypothetical protein
MLTFHVTVHAKAQGVAAGPVVELVSKAGKKLTVPTVAMTAEALAQPFGISFEEAVERLGQLARMFVEPDGSFVWVSSADDPKWQVDGNLFDRNGRLLRVDLKGTCDERPFDKLLTALGWPETQIVFELVREAVFVDETTFRQYARNPGSTS